MKIYKLLVNGIALIVIIGVVSAGTLKGHVNFDGKGPKPKKVKMGADPVCGSSHSKPVYSESFKMAKDGSLAEVLVYLRNVNYKGGVPKKSVVLNQKGCVYMPHVFGMMRGQTLLIKNSDATLHNIHSMPKLNKEFNFAMPKVVKEKAIKIAKPEHAMYIKCDVHPWMKSYISIFNHPYFSVTDDTGHYQIDNIPPGTYTVIAWQEKFKNKETKEWKTLNATVTIGDGDTGQDFTFVKEAKKK